MEVPSPGRSIERRACEWSGVRGDRDFRGFVERAGTAADACGQLRADCAVRSVIWRGRNVAGLGS